MFAINGLPYMRYSSKFIEVKTHFLKTTTLSEYTTLTNQSSSSIRKCSVSYENF